MNLYISYFGLLVKKQQGEKQQHKHVWFRDPFFVTLPTIYLLLIF